jgi:gluconate 2-dehydrogenase gamma chain
MKSLTRRRALLGLGASAAGSAISCMRSAGASPWRFFTAEEGQTLEAASAQLIPADRDPGAKEAGAINYIDLQLSVRWKRYRETYRRGIAAIDGASRTQFGKRFVELASGQQVQVLQAIERDAAPFFNLFLDHTRQGFYCDPRHGGNRNRVSWKMLGLPFPQVRGRQHYETPQNG